MANTEEPRSYESRDIQVLSSIKPSEWTAIELKYHHKSMSELAPWLNEQGTYMHGQIIQEIERRGGLTL
ncbi:hypothetical protein ICC18_19725 [Paenibacillus sp. WST5]|uniref:Uncharacterized protein n=2 Tax=Paenibacillus sedimenti TaxID=2770274 RepID=A0A926KQZ9_9BACL|nr:hypothetical protein [Paenibacillus sedimenti]MBD0382350.1 hypothetical protein [Paenibacillus sedimenti]